MKKRIFVAGLVLLIACASAHGQGSGVSTPNSRNDALERAHASLAERPAPNLEELRAMKDPFNPPETDLKDLIVDTSIRPKDTGPKLVSDADVLQVLASSITPTGSVTVGGEPYLLFGEKRLKTGDRYTVTKDGVDYAVIIDSIESSRFSIRYNSQVLFRQIK
ncbi:MAG TPA: hypothetical protein VMM36_04290 [Opitutaceae bacterium]|nr:hypothetical protein [Opitutaceae bacterium]